MVSYMEEVVVCVQSAKWQHISDCSESMNYYPLPLPLCSPILGPALWKPLYFWSGTLRKEEVPLSSLLGKQIAAQWAMCVANVGPFSNLPIGC